MQYRDDWTETIENGGKRDKGKTSKKGKDGKKVRHKPGERGDHGKRNGNKDGRKRKGR